MKSLNQMSGLRKLFYTAFLAGAGWISPANILAAEHKLFAAPDDAMKALQAAAAAREQSAMTEIFGAEFRELQTGDKVQDANHLQKFADAVAQGCKPVPEGD